MRTLGNGPHGEGAQAGAWVQISRMGNPLVNEVIIGLDRKDRWNATDASDEQVVAAARAAQAHEFVEALPDGYETVIGERGITLSGGQRQRLAIARAILIDPRILVLDDATASVDATTEARIREGLREVMRGRTTIIIAHRLSTIQLADEVVVLEHGRVTARGTQEELLEDNDVYRELHEHGLLEGLLEERIA